LNPVYDPTHLNLVVQAGTGPGSDTPPDRPLPSVVHWVNPAGGDWSNPTNWSTGRLPGLLDDVVIDVPGGVTITHSTGEDTVHSLTCEDNLILSGGTLALISASVIDGTFTLTNAVLKGPGDLTLNGAFSWSGFGSMSGGGHTRTNGSSILNALLLDNR